MKILFHLAHPAQFHMFKYVIKNLTNNGHIVKITINTKDILEKLLKESEFEYENILKKRRKKNTKLATFFTLIKKDFKILKTQLKGNYDLFVGTEGALAHVGWLLRIPVLIMDEDDIKVIPEASLITFPFAKFIVSPISCDLGKWTKKKIEYNGYQKIAYLHPSLFIANKNIVKKIITEDEKYFLLRISGLTAYHDTGVKGFTEEIIRKIIEILKPHGRVLISTERKLSEDLNQYLFKTDVSNIHHFLYFAEILIADSQSMCVEAAIIGTPSIRFSDFVGRIGVLEELEHRYYLTFGINPSDPEKLYNKIRYLLGIYDLKLIFHQKRDSMLHEKIDVTSFWTWLIENYPKSIKIIKENPDFHNSFINN